MNEKYDSALLTMFIHFVQINGVWFNERKGGENKELTPEEIFDLRKKFIDLWAGELKSKL